MARGSIQPDGYHYKASDQGTDCNIDPKQKVVKSIKVAPKLGKRMLKIELPFHGNSDDPREMLVESCLDRVEKAESGERRARRHDRNDQESNGQPIDRAHHCHRRAYNSVRCGCFTKSVFLPFVPREGR
jgi:hypothetical protein